MAKQVREEENHVSFTLLVPESSMKTIAAIAKDKERTKGFVVREAIEKFLNGRKRR